MLRYKTETRPGLVALYDIRPGNGAGQFLQPRSPHGTELTYKVECLYVCLWVNEFVTDKLDSHTVYPNDVIYC